MKIPCGDLNLADTLDSGQVFGYKKLSEGKYEGLLLGHPVVLSQSAGMLNVTNGVSPLKAEIVKKYFDLDRDLYEIYSTLRAEAPLKPAFEKYKGLRLIRQDAWEALACFIISSNNNVKRIMGIHENLITYFSKRRKSITRQFPSTIEVASVHEKTLRELGLGYRAPFLWGTAKFLSNNAEYLKTIRDGEYQEARERALAFPGIGPKVADCVLLYGFHKLEAFPVDVWILRAMRKLYFKNRRVSEERVRQFGMKRWGKSAGYIQQYIFHAARHSVI